VWIVTVFLGISLGPANAVAQDAQPLSNVEVLGQLAIDCIGGIPDSLSSFSLESTDRMPYLRPQLTEFWRGQGKQVFLSDSLVSAPQALPLHRLHYDPEEAVVRYDDEKDAKLRRMVTLAIRHSLVAPTGLLVDDGRCRKQYSDVISRQGVALVERDPFPETHGRVPAEGSWRDWAEPAILAASVGVVAYLFFSIRSS
jgi:hypothetical protein